jgi:outer membrane protein assembly factor BamB
VECLALSDGHKIWAVNFEKDFGVKFLGSKAKEGTASRRGNNGSPLIDGDALITIVGAPDGGSIVALNKLTGKGLWKTGSDEAAYSSPISAQLAGTYQIVALTADALTGVDRKTGETLWRVPLKTNAKRHAMTPVIFGDTIIVNSHTFGMISFRISNEGTKFEASEVWSNKDLKINLATPVLIDHWLFSQGPAKNYVCVDAKTGELMWSQPGFGKEVTSSIAFGKNIVTFADDGQVAVLEANPAKYVELSRFQAAGKNWNHPAFADGRLFIRDYHEIIGFDLGSK